MFLNVAKCYCRCVDVVVVTVGWHCCYFSCYHSWLSLLLLLLSLLLSLLLVIVVVIVVVVILVVIVGYHSNDHVLNLRGIQAASGSPGPVHQETK